MKPTKIKFKGKKRIHRLPRPLGLTLLSQTLNLTNPKQEKVIPEDTVHKIFQYILTNNLTIRGERISLTSLSTLLGLPEITIFKQFALYNNKLSKAFLGEGTNYSGALKFFGLKNILESHAHLGTQRAHLQRSQGGRYRPFVTDSLNTALMNELAGSKAILEVAKMLDTKSHDIAFNNSFQAININTSEGLNNTAIKAITITEAIKILDEKGFTKIGYSEEVYKGIEEHIKDTPEIRATHQENVGSDNVPLMPSSLKHHTTRRVKEEGIDPEIL